MTYLPLPTYFVKVFCLVSCVFRALLEGERLGLQDAHRRVNQHQRERIIGTFLNCINFIVAIDILLTRELFNTINENISKY